MRRPFGIESRSKLMCDIRAAHLHVDVLYISGAVLINIRITQIQSRTYGIRIGIVKAARIENDKGIVHHISSDKGYKGI